MAKIPGGITSRPAGKVGNIVFGAARTAEGKVATARQLVSPSNPDTPAQQSQRSKFDRSLDIVQDLGPAIYQDDWNRAVGQLPGFQSWMSVLLNNMDGNLDLSPPPVRPLGNLHFPDSASAATGTATGEIDVSFSTESGDNGTSSDELVVVSIEAGDPLSGDRETVTQIANVTRSAGADTITMSNGGRDCVVGIYFRGAGSADGTLSAAHFFTASSAT